MCVPDVKVHVLVLVEVIVLNRVDNPAEVAHIVVRLDAVAIVLKCAVVAVVDNVIQVVLDVITPVRVHVATAQVHVVDV